MTMAGAPYDLALHPDFERDPAEPGYHYLV